MRGGLHGGWLGVVSVAMVCVCSGFLPRTLGHEAEQQSAAALQPAVNRAGVGTDGGGAGLSGAGPGGRADSGGDHLAAGQLVHGRAGGPPVRRPAPRPPAVLLLLAGWCGDSHGDPAEAHRPGAAQAERAQRAPTEPRHRSAHSEGNSSKHRPIRNGDYAAARAYLTDAAEKKWETRSRTIIEQDFCSPHLTASHGQAADGSLQGKNLGRLQADKPVRAADE